MFESQDCNYFNFSKRNIFNGIIFNTCFISFKTNPKYIIFSYIRSMNINHVYDLFYKYLKAYSTHLNVSENKMTFKTIKSFKLSD
jgi:hypothetical protein